MVYYFFEFIWIFGRSHHTWMRGPVRSNKYDTSLIHQTQLQYPGATDRRILTYSELTPPDPKSCVLHIWDDSFFVLFHFRAAFTMGEEVGVTFPGSWGT